MTDHQKQIIRLLAENNMSIAATARQMFFHRNAIVYHIEKIQMETGLAAHKFYDLCKLLELIEEVSS